MPIPRMKPRQARGAVRRAERVFVTVQADNMVLAVRVSKKAMLSALARAVQHGISVPCEDYYGELIVGE